MIAIIISLLGFAVAFFLLYIGDNPNYAESPYPIFKFIHHHSSHLFVAFLTVFLPFMLYRIEKFREHLSKHQEDMENKHKQLLEEEKLIRNLHKKIDYEFNEFINYAVNKTRLFDLSKHGDLSYAA